MCVCLREHKTLYLWGVGQDRYNVSVYVCINSTFFDWDLKALFQTACLQNTTQQSDRQKTVDLHHDTVPDPREKWVSLDFWIHFEKKKTQKGCQQEGWRDWGSKAPHGSSHQPKHHNVVWSHQKKNLSVKALTLDLSCKHWRRHSGKPLPILGLVYEVHLLLQSLVWSMR